MEFEIQQIAQLLNGTVKGDPRAKVNKISKIQEAEEGSLSFLANMNYENFLYETNATAVLISKNFNPKKEVKTNLILVDDPYEAFARIVDIISKYQQQQKKGIESPVFISQSAKLGENVYIGAFSYIGENVKIGNNSKIYPQTFIGDNTTIGENTIIYPGVKIYPNTMIGNNCIIHAGAVIGSDGFGFAPQKDGSYIKIQQLGNVIIEDNVEIGSNTTIDRAALGSTLIKKGTKLDNLIQVAHNVTIGENTVIAAQAGIAGSAQIGNNCMIAGQVGIAGHIKIADKTTLAAQAGVISSIEESEKTLVGSPAMDLKQYFKAFAVYKNLPELQKQLTLLQKQIEELKKTKS